MKVAYISLRTSDVRTIAHLTTCENPQLAGEVLILADDPEMWEASVNKVTGLPVYMDVNDDGRRLVLPVTISEWNTLVEWAHPGCGFVMME